MICALAAVLAAISGPRIAGPRSRSAGEPFVYEPPEGFVPAKDAKASEVAAKVWVHEAAEKRNFDGSAANPKALSTRVVLNHSNKEMSVEETELAKLVREMPQAFEGVCTWVHRRHEMRMRADGARVGLIEGDCDRNFDLSPLGLTRQTVKERRLQLMFPDDSGTWIVTASYPTDEATRWEPLFEATIGKAKGVATRAPAPPVWAYAGWGAAGAVLAWLAMGIVSRKGNEPAPAREDKRPTRERVGGRRERENEQRKKEEDEEKEDA